MRRAVFSLVLSVAFSACVYADTLAVWNFNDALSGVSGGVTEFLIDRGSGTMGSSFNPANIGNASGSTINSTDGDPAGYALRLSGSANNGKDLTWMVSTVGFDSIGISFAALRTGTGYSSNQFQYSTDSGISWISFAAPFAPGLTFALQSYDLSGIQGLSDNPGAGFRILFEGATSSTGNNRIDNLVVSGNPLPPAPTEVPEPSAIALTSAGVACILLSRKEGGRRRPNGARCSGINPKSRHKVN